MPKKYNKIKLGPREAFGVIPFRDVAGKKEFLLLQSVNGHWSFPKGKAQEGESMKETALRELKEETGIKNVKLNESRMFEEIYDVPTDAGPVRKVVKYYLGEVYRSVNVIIKKDEIQNYAWVPMSAAEERITYKESKQMFHDVVNYLELESSVVNHP